MQLFCLSISHHHTPIELRDCLSLSSQAIQAALSDHPLRQSPYEALREMTLLSTCNRFEAYGVASLADDGAAPGKIIDLVSSYLQEALQVPPDILGRTFHAYTGLQAARHLFRVAAGLDSIALGETQILGQVARSLEVGLAAGGARHVLSSLFRAAIHAGKKVRSDTGIGRHPTNISAIGVQMVEEYLGNLANKKILVVGAGKMGGLALDTLQSRAYRQVFLTNRSPNRAADLASRANIRTLPYDDLGGSLANADVVFTFTSAPEPVIDRSLLAGVMARRSDQAPLTLVDLAMPRNVSSDAREVPGVTVLDMDDLRQFARRQNGQDLQDVSQAEAIVAAEVNEYEKLLRVIPFIGELHKKIEAIRQREVDRALRHLPEATPEVKEQIEIMSQSLVRKVLHEPTMHLRTETNEETLNDYVDALAQLYNLTETDENSVNISRWPKTSNTEVYGEITVDSARQAGLDENG